MEFDSNHTDLYESFSNDRQLTQSCSPTLFRRKSSSAESATSTQNGYVKQLRLPVSNNNGSSLSLTTGKFNKFRQGDGPYKNLPSSVSRNTARLSALGAAVGESLKNHRRSHEAIQYLEQSVDDDEAIQTIVQIKKDEETDSGEHRAWFKKFSRKQLLTLMSLCLVDFTSSMCMSIMAPFFPMEATAKGMDEAIIGLVFSTYALVMFISSLLFGRTLPYFGSHFLFFSGLFLAAGCTVLFGILDFMTGVEFTVFCFVVRSMEAFGAAAFNTAACTIVAQIFPDNVSAVFGLLETFVGLGMTLGPAVGGLLYSAWGFGVPFYSLGAFMLFMIPVNMWLLPVEQISDTSSQSSSMYSLLKQPSVLIMIFVTIIQTSAWSFLDPFLQPHLSDNFALTSGDVGLVFLMLSATYGICCPLFGWVADRWGHTSVMMTSGMILTSISLLIIGPTPLLPFLPNELWLNMIALILLGMATPLGEIPTFESMIDNAIDSGFEDDIATYSIVSGLWSAAFSLGEFVGPSLGGVLVTEYSFDGASTGLAGLILLPAIMLVTYEIVLRCKKTPEKLPINPERASLPAATDTTPLLKSLS